MIPLGNNMETYLLAAFFSLVAAGCVAGGVHFLVGQKNRKEELFAQWETEGDEGPDLEETQVRILKKYCMATMYGTKSPQSRKEFFLTFETRDGKNLTYAVEEEVYLSLKEGQPGILVTANGNFYGFCPNEDE